VWGEGHLATDGMGGVCPSRRYRPLPPPQGGSWPTQGGLENRGPSWGTQSEYSGEMLAGRRHGQGVERWIDGITYRGSWRNGQKEGLGTWEHPNGQKYEVCTPCKA